MSNFSNLYVMITWHGSSTSRTADEGCGAVLYPLCYNFVGIDHENAQITVIYNISYMKFVFISIFLFILGVEDLDIR